MFNNYLFLEFLHVHGGTMATLWREEWNIKLEAGSIPTTRKDRLSLQLAYWPL